jgi:signal transduction histidine kinase
MMAESHRPVPGPHQPAAPKASAALDAALVTVIVVLVVATAVAAVVPGVHFQVFAPALDLVLDTITGAVTLAVAALAWVRYRQGGEPMALFQVAAFLVLAIASILNVALQVSGLTVLAGMGLANPGQAPLYVQTFARLLAAALLVVGGLGSLRSSRLDHPVAVVLGTSGAMLVMILLIQAGAASLPSLGSAGTLPPPGAGPSMPMPTPLGAAVQVVAAALFLWAAGLSRRLYRRDGSTSDAYLAVGLVIAAFAQVQAALYPGTYAGIVTSGALLRLVFDVLLLLGIQAEAGETLARLHRANEDLARLGAVEAEHAALEERTHLSRELHDGLAQDLWLAKLKTARLAAQPELGPEATALAGELGQAIDAGLADAQQAVAALRGSREPAGTLCDVMSRSVDEFADRFGLHVELDCQPDMPQLPARTQAETLRVALEALSNVVRHADATVVRVRASVEDGRLHLMVRDNGCGFDVGALGDDAFGLASMRERAALIGGELRIDSRPSDGTRVSLLVPLAGAGTPGVGGPG